VTWPKGLRAGTDGQALVEFAIALPIFVALTLGLVDGARLVFADNTVSQAARDAARLASVQAAYIGVAASECQAPTCPATTGAFSANVLAAANRMTAVIGQIPAAGMYITCSALGSAPTGAWTGGNKCTSSNDSGNVVSVRIVVPVSPLTPIFGPIYPRSLSASATMAIP
jgi:TadE-like protein